MAAGGRFKMLGLPQLDDEVRKVSAELMEAEQPSAMAAGEPILDKWRGMVPVLDGNYRDSLQLVWLGKQGAAVGTGWLPGVERDDQPFIYSKTLEFGRDQIPAQPSARPALAAARSEALDAGGGTDTIRGARTSRPQEEAHMSLDAALFGYLSGELSVGSRVYPFGVRPQSSQLPAVTYQLVAGPTSHYSHGGTSDREVSYQLDCWAENPDDAMDLDTEVRALLDGFRGTWGDHRIGSVFLSLVLDDYEPKVGLYRRLRQADIHYSEPSGS